MNWLGELARRLNMLFHRRQFDADLEEEMRLHLEMRQREQLASGMTSRDATAAARRRFGNATILREKSHSAWGWEWLEHFLQDINYGIRAMLRSPGITLVALFSLALGIGANTAIFSLTDAVLLKSLPVNDPAQLVLFGDGLDEGISDGFPNRWLFSYPFYREMQKRNHVFSDVAAAFSMTNRVHGFVQGRRDSEPMSVQLVSGTYFPMLGVHAMLGRSLCEDDDRTQGGHPVTMVSYAWWTRNLARDPSVLTKKLIIGSTSFSIVGVAPPEFFGTKVGEAPDIWIPLSMQKEVPPGFNGYNDDMFESLHLMARLKPGVTVPEATANANLLYPQILRGFSGAPLTQENLQKLDKTRVELNSLATGFSRLRYQFSEPLKILMAVVGLVLLVACANIANLLLARSTARTRELAVRQALGAGRSRLIRQLLTESLVLALAGGALGVVFASAASHLLIHMVSDGRIPLHLNVPLDMRLLFFTLCVTLSTALLFGTIPAFRATRVNLTDSLKDGRSQSAASRGPLAKVLVVSQVALSLVLLVGAGLFVRSLLNLTNVDTGFNKENVLRLRVDTSSAGYLEDTRLVNLYQQIEQRVSTVPGVRAASFSIFAFNEGTWNNSIWVQGYLVLPIVNENDTVSTAELETVGDSPRSVTFSDNDRLAALVMSGLEADALILLTNVDGLLNIETSAKHKRAGSGSRPHVIPLISKVTPELRALASGPSQSGRGGMVTKLEAAEIAMNCGGVAVIANGSRAETLPRIFAGESEGTVFLPSNRMKGKRRWLAYAARVRGRVVVDAGAQRALTGGKASLLSSGVVRIEKAFGLMDVVSIANVEGNEIARGIANCASEAAATARVLFTRDNIVLMERDA
jgi:cell division protein FtsX